MGASRAVTTAARAGTDAAKAANTARNLRIAATGVEAAQGAFRAGQGVYAVSNGKTEDAYGYFGEALLRFIGVSAVTLKELKAARAVKDAELNVLRGNPGSPRVPNGGANSSGGVLDGILSNFSPAQIAKFARKVLTADIRVDYLKGAKGASPIVDKIADVLQQASAEQATKLRMMADLAANRGAKPLEQVIPDFQNLSANTKSYLRGNPNNLGGYGRSLHDLLEEALREAGQLRALRLTERASVPGGIPDYQYTFPNGSYALFDLTGKGSAGKILKKYNQADAVFLVELIHPGP
jgi:hypothetical protein